MSESDSDEQFESADEGDDHVDETSFVKSDVGTQIEESSRETKPTKSEPEVVSSDIPPVTKQEHEEITTKGVQPVQAREEEISKQVNSTDNPTLINTETVSKELSSLSIEDSTFLNKDDNSSHKERSENKPQPQARISRVDTRGKQRSKPSLGAKKLGAVKIDSDLVDFENHTSIDTVTHSHNLKEVDSNKEKEESATSWGTWFAPPKLLVSSISSFTNQIITSVESGLNIPDPEELAKECRDEAPPVERDSAAAAAAKGLGLGLFTEGMTSLSKIMGNTKTKVISTGLDTLETIGRKTMTVLQETDPGFKKTKSVLISPLIGSQPTPNLSQILKEAKESNSQESNQPAFTNQSKPALSSFLEQHHGLAHLEALEMLSQMSESRVSSQLRHLNTQRKRFLEEIGTICSTIEDTDDSGESEDFDLQQVEQYLQSSFDKIGLELTIKKMMDVVRRAWKGDHNEDSIQEFYCSNLSTLAQVTSVMIQTYHQASEIIVRDQLRHKTSGKFMAEVFRGVTCEYRRILHELGSLSAQQIILREKEDSTHYSTDIYVEVSNCSSFLEKALKLMIPIFQSRSP